MDLAVVVGAFAFGYESTELIEEVADLGLLLLLFGVGLTLRPGSLQQPTVWGTTLVVAAGTVAVVTTTLDARGDGAPTRRRDGPSPSAC